MQPVPPLDPRRDRHGARRPQPPPRTREPDGPARVAGRRDRASLVARAFGALVVDRRSRSSPTPRSATPPRQRGARPHGLVDVHRPALALEAVAVTPLRPFLRWDPVQPPAIVARHRFTAGESLRQLVVRSGVTQDLDTLEITVEPPAAYAADHAASRLPGRQRAAPRAAQDEPESRPSSTARSTTAIGSTDPADHQQLLAVALREAGTLFDVDVPRLDDPSERDPQPGIDLVADPTVPPRRH